MGLVAPVVLHLEAWLEDAWSRAFQQEGLRAGALAVWREAGGGKHIHTHTHTQTLFISFYFYFLKFVLECSCFTMLCEFLLQSKMNQLMQTYFPSFLDFLLIQVTQRIDWSALCCRVGSHYLSLLYVVSIVQIHQFQSPNSSYAPFHPWYPYICSPRLCLYFCFVNKIVYTNLQGQRFREGCFSMFHLSSQLGALVSVHLQGDMPTVWVGAHPSR